MAQILEAISSRIALSKKQELMIKRTDERLSQLKSKSEQLNSQLIDLHAKTAAFRDNVNISLMQLRENEKHLVFQVERFVELNRRMMKRLKLVETLYEADDLRSDAMQDTIGELRQLLVEDEALIKDWEDECLMRGKYTQELHSLDILLGNGYEQEK